MYYYDLIYVLPALLLTLLASAGVKSAYQKYSRVTPRCRITGAQAARRILDAYGLTEVRLERVAGEMTDHFDPSSNTVRLSEGVYDASTLAALGIAAHECGHAVQYAKGYVPIRIRAAIIPVTNFGANFAMPMVILGIALTYLSETLLAIAYAGVILFGFAVLFQLVTLPVEFNASRRAVKELASVLDPDEMPGVKAVLRAAAMTYVAALASAVLQLVRLLAIVGNNDRRRR